MNPSSNLALDSESAHIGALTFNIFSIICSSVTVRCAQFRSARRYMSYRNDVSLKRSAASLYFQRQRLT